MNYKNELMIQMDEPPKNFIDRANDDIILDEDQTKEFIYIEFTEINDNLSKIYYIFDHVHPTEIYEHELYDIMEHILCIDDEVELILPALLKFLNTHIIQFQAKFSEVYEKYLKDLEISSILINIFPHYKQEQ